jgi:hypothetical protein
VSFRFFDNTGGEPSETCAPVEPKSYPESRKQLDAILDAEYRAGHVTAEEYRKIGGFRND